MATTKGRHMSEFVPNADLYDEHGENLQSCDIQFRQFGARSRFEGVIVTVRCREDNALLKEVLSGAGRGKVAVVDGGGSVHCALLGDQIGETATRNGWEGIIIYGAVRDSTALAVRDLGVKALGTNPRKSQKLGIGETEVPVSFGGVTFAPGARIVSDEDGITVLGADGRL